MLRLDFSWERTLDVIPDIPLKKVSKSNDF